MPGSCRPNEGVVKYVKTETAGRLLPWIHWRMLVMLLTVLILMECMAGTTSRHGVDALPVAGHHGNSRHHPHAHGAPRRGRCLDDVSFRECFLCGKQSDDSRIYFGCCDGEDSVVSFCDLMAL